MKWWSKHRRKILALASSLALGVLAVVAGAVYVVSSTDFEQLVADNLVRFIDERTGMQASLEAVELDFQSQRVALIGLVLRGEEGPDDPPLLAIDRVDVEVRWRALVSRRIDLASVRIQRPELRVQIGDNGETNFPPVPAAPPGGEAAGGFDLFVGDLGVDGGLIAFNEQRIDADFRLTAFEGAFDYVEATRALAGDITYAGIIDRAGEPEIPYVLEARFEYTSGTAMVQTMRVTSGGSELRLQGRVDQVLRDRTGALAYTGTVELPFLNYFVADADVEGAMEVAGALDFSTTHFATTGDMTSESLRFREWTGTGVTSAYAYDFPQRVLTATGFGAGIFGGRADGNLIVSPLPGAPRVEMDLRFSQISAAALRPYYPWDAPYVVRSRATGTMAGWFEGAFDDFNLSGNVRLTAGAVPVGGAIINLPLTGTSAYHATPGQVEVDQLRGTMGATAAEASGVIREEDFFLEVAAVLGDLTDARFVFPEANGSGTFQGRLSGLLAQPEVAGAFTLDEFTWDDWTIDSIAGDLEYRDDVVGLDGVRVLEGNSDVTVDGSIDLRTGEPDVDVAIASLDPEDVRAFVPYPVSGHFTGNLNLTGLDPIDATGRLIGTDVVYDTTPVGTLETDVTVRPGRIELRNVSVMDRDTSLAGLLDYDTGTGAIHVEFEASGHQIEDLVAFGVPDGFGGLVRDARFVIDGTLSSPLIEGQARVQDLRFREQVFREAVIDVDNAGQVVRASVGAGEQLEVAVEINMSAGGYPFSGSARFTDYDAARLTGLDPGTIAATGVAAFEGSLDDLTTLRGSGEVLALNAHLDERDLVVARPFTFEFDTRQVRVSSIDLSDETTSITLEGTVALTPDAPLNLTVLGNLDLGLIATTTAELTVGGNLSIQGEVTGNLQAPELRGLAELTGASLQYAGLPLGLTNLAGDLFFDGNSVNVIGMTGAAGGGTVAVNGTIAIEGIGPGAMTLDIDASNIRVRTPEGLRTVFDGVFTLSGTPANPTLEGTIGVSSLSFDESFEQFLGLFGQAAPGVTGPGETGPLDRLNLALHIDGEDGIRIQNELVGVSAARLDLDVAGTLAEPTLVGHIESTEGVLTFQGERYDITRGNVDFIDPVGIEPLIDVQAETDVRDYRIILTITGSASEPRLEMRSDPPLSQLEIVSLIAGGRTREELADAANGAATPTGEELFQGAAATLLTDLLQERVGSRFGLGTRVRIDPFLVGAENDPVARLTVSEQITRDLTITYSQDLASNRQEVILIEYFLNNDTSFIASRDETGAVGLDIKLRKRFR